MVMLSEGKEDMLIVALLLALLLIMALGIKRWYRHRLIMAAGRRGEAVVTSKILGVLRKGDLLFTNVSIQHEGNKVEIDNIVVNKKGVFIIEAKNYSGTIKGTLDDRYWKKRHTTRKGEFCEKEVKNPIPQVKRQVHYLANYLRGHGIQIWVDGFVVFTNNNSPVKSRFILTDTDAIEGAIHPILKNRLTAAKIEIIAGLLKKYKWKEVA